MMSSRTPVDYSALTVEDVVRRMSPGHKDALVELKDGNLDWADLVDRVRQSLVHKGLVSRSGEVTPRGRSAARMISVDRAANWEKYL
jgi:hypothetical protein